MPISGVMANTGIPFIGNMLYFTFFLDLTASAKCSPVLVECEGLLEDDLHHSHRKLPMQQAVISK